MKRKLRGLKRTDIQYDFDLYRRPVPITGVAGAELSVIDLHPEGVEATVLFVHGYGGCAETWEFQLNYFTRNYRVVAMDLRGHGQSDAPYTQYTMREMIDDIEAVREHLKLPETFVLVGHSFGGSICIEYANAHRERLEKLILIATAGEYPLPRAATLLYQIPSAIYRLFWRYRPRWNAEIHVLKRMMMKNLRHWRGWPTMRSLTTSTLVITGERDNYFPRRVFEDVGRMIPGAEVIDVGSAKHKIQLERHMAVNRAIERFISTEKRSWRGKTVEARRPWLASYSPGTPHTIPIPRQPMHRFLESAAAWVPKRRALVFKGWSMNYGQLNARANHFAHALHGLGVRPGDRVMLVLPNSAQFVVGYYATLKIGGVVVLPNPDADAGQIRDEIVQTGAKVLFTLRQYEAMTHTLKPGTTLEHVIFSDITGHTLTHAEKVALRQSGHIFEDMLRDAPDDPPPVEVGVDDPAVIAFTSGTTDEPKGVCLSHRNLVANTMQTRHWVPDLLYGREVFLSVLPFLHSYGMTGAMNVPIAIGATIILLPVFELQTVLETIRRYRPTIFPGVPSMYTAINHAHSVRSYGLDSIKACISGAAPLPVEVQEEFEKLTRGRLVEGYGMTECGPVTHANPLYGQRKVGSIGVPIPNTDAKIVDLVTGEDLPPGRVGELAVCGPQVMTGYWASSQEPNPESIIRDGWLMTGDVAVMDAEGYFQIISRKRDTIMAGEYSVYPRDVEEVLYENSKVLEAAVVGVGTANGTQRVKAFVVPRPGTTLSAEELIELCRRRLEEYAVPLEIEFRETLPKSFVGKVLRRVLVEVHADGRKL